MGKALAASEMASIAVDDNGRPVSLQQKLNVAGGRRAGPSEVIQQAVRYIEQRPERAHAILQDLAPKVGAPVGSARQPGLPPEALLRSIAFQSNMDAIRSLLLRARIAGAEFARRDQGVAALLLYEASGGEI